MKLKAKAHEFNSLAPSTDKIIDIEIQNLIFFKIEKRPSLIFRHRNKFIDMDLEKYACIYIPLCSASTSLSPIYIDKKDLEYLKSNMNKYKDYYYSEKDIYLKFDFTRNEFAEDCKAGKTFIFQNGFLWNIYDCE